MVAGNTGVAGYPQRDVHNADGVFQHYMPDLRQSRAGVDPDIAVQLRRTFNGKTMPRRISASPRRYAVLAKYCPNGM